MNSKKYIAWDVDGTLFSSESILPEIYRDSVTEYSQKHSLNIPIPTKEAIFHEVGKPVKTIFQNLLPELQDFQRDEISKFVLEKLTASVKNGNGEIYPNTKKTLLELKKKGYLFLGASNGRSPYVEAVLESVGVTQEFLPRLYVNETHPTKAHLLKTYIQTYEIEPANLVMVGDRFSDYEAAFENKTKFAFCKYGHIVPGEIPNFDFALERIESILQYL